MTFVGAEERALWVAAAVRALPRIVPTEPPIRDPDHWLAMCSLRAGETLTVTVQNIGATPELVDEGAVFFARPYNGALS